MESYSQPWTVIAKIEKYENEPIFEEGCFDKEERIYGRCHEEKVGGLYSHKPEWYKCEKPEGQWRSECHYKTERPEYYNHKLEYNGLKPEYYGRKFEYKSYKPEYYSHKSEYYTQKPEYYTQKPEYYTHKPEYYNKLEKPQWLSKSEKMGQNELPEWQRMCEKLEKINIDGTLRWRCGEGKCCDEEMIKQVKNLITILIGAEQSYIQLGYLCMDEKFTLVNTAEYFRLCGLRMHWLANGLINRSCRLFNVNEWINKTHFENWFKVPTKEELATNDFTSILKTLFKTCFEAETRLFEVMNMLGENIMKKDVISTECRFDGLKWFINFVLPYQTHFLGEVRNHYKNIEMCNNGYIFDKCEMSTLVNKIEEFIHRLVKVNLKTGGNKWVVEKIQHKRW